MSFSRFPAGWSLCAIFLLSTSPAFSQTEDKAKLIEGAKKEGRNPSENPESVALWPRLAG